MRFSSVSTFDDAEATEGDESTHEQTDGRVRLRS
jgi:hypothetical protein